MDGVGKEEEPLNPQDMVQKLSAMNNYDFIIKRFGDSNNQVRISDEIEGSNNVRTPKEEIEYLGNLIDSNIQDRFGGECEQVNVWLRENDHTNGLLDCDRLDELRDKYVWNIE